MGETPRSETSPCTLSVPKTAVVPLTSQRFILSTQAAAAAGFLLSFHLHSVSLLAVHATLRGRPGSRAGGTSTVLVRIHINLRSAVLVTDLKAPVGGATSRSACDTVQEEMRREERTQIDFVDLRVKPTPRSPPIHAG